MRLAWALLGLLPAPRAGGEAYLLACEGETRVDGELVDCAALARGRHSQRPDPGGAGEGPEVRAGWGV